MPTPEEMIADLQNQLKAANEKAGATDSLSEQLANMKKDMDTANAERQKEKLEFAKKDVFNKYENLRGVEGAERFIHGLTPEEIDASAKAFSESLMKRDDAFKKKQEEETQQKWTQLPGSTPNTIAMTKDRQDEYAEAKKIPNRVSRISRLMQLHWEDAGKRYVNVMKRSMGLS